MIRRLLQLLKRTLPGSRVLQREVDDVPAEPAYETGVAAVLTPPDLFRRAGLL